MNPVIELILRDHLTVAQAARNFHTTRQSIYAWMHNESVPNFQHRLILMKQVGWSADKMTIWVWIVALGHIGIEYHITSSVQPVR